METFEIEVRKSTTERKYVPLPIYRKDHCHAYLVFSQKHAITVIHGLVDAPGIEVSHAGIAWNKDITEDCTSEEFMALYNETLQRIQEITKQSLQHH